LAFELLLDANQT